MFRTATKSFLATGLLACATLAAANNPAAGHASPHAGPARGHSQAPASMTVPFELVDRLIMVEAEVNGVAGNFLVDSGAPVVVINQARFAPGVIESRELDHAAPSGAGGTMTEVRGASNLELRWGEVRMQELAGMVTDLTHLEENLGGIELHGLIGYNVLEPFQVHFDYDRQQLTLLALSDDGRPADAVDPGQPGLSVPFELMGHIPVVPIRIGGLDLKLGLDSGAAGEMIFTRWRDKLEGQYQFIRQDEMRGADRNVQTGDVVLVPEVQFGDISYGGMTFRFNDLAGHGDRDVPFDGLLGYGFLKTFPTAINFRSRQLMIWPSGAN